MESSGSVNLTLRNKFKLDIGEIHSDVYPIDIRDSDRVLARIRPRENDSEREYQPIQVWKLSPLGIELLQSPGGTSYSKGDLIDLEITLAGQRTSFEGLVVDLVCTTENIEFLGIRLSRRMASPESVDEKRRAHRWSCSDEFFPTCMAPTPGRFDDFVYFQIRDISHEGLQLVCSLRNKFLITGLRLKLIAVFPMGSVTSLQVEITRVGITSIGGRDKLVVGSKFIELSDFARQSIGQYLVQFSDVDSLEALRAVGLAPRSVALGVDFYNLKSEEDYFEVLKLRKLSHELDGNLKEQVDTLDMGDMSDATSRIVVGKFRGKIVATARIRYNELDEPLEHEAHVTWPKELPRRDQIIEVSRVATHPNFRRNDLLAALFRFACQNVVQPERPWVVMSCLDRMVPFYTKIGFRQTGIRHTEPLWREDRVLNVLIVNISDMVLGRGVNPIYWNYLWRGLASLLIEQRAVSPTGMDNARLMFYRALGPLVNFTFHFRRPRQTRKSRLV